MDPVTPISPVTPITTVSPQIQSPTSVVYAGFWTRFWAYLIDGVVVSVGTFIISLVSGIILGIVTGTSDVSSSTMTLAKSFVNIITYILAIVYYIYFIGAKGQTVGKMAMKIKVVKVGTNNPPGYVYAFLREIIGKFLSALALYIGFFAMIKNPKKQTWYDRMAGTVVIKV